MQNYNVLRILFALILLLSASQTAKASDSAASENNSLQTGDVDLTRLPLGDNRLSDSPKVGWIWPCRVNPGIGGAFKNGPWLNIAASTYDFTAKAVVDGTVKWSQHHIEIALKGNQRVITTNDLPDHTTGIFPIARNDDAYQYDRNPNHIASQNIEIAIPANPVLAAQPSCAPNAIGILLSGAALFNALDGPGRDAVAHETQDSCQGHPERSSTYHYHNVTSCLPDTTTEDGHSALVGYALDGFGIFGHRDVGGKVLTSADLDECHGHTHEIEWDGKKVVIYHYHATWDFPYSIGCMRGAYDPRLVMALAGNPGGGPPNQQGGQGQPPRPPR
jgi:hypothetical protein